MLAMRRILVVARREFVAAVKTKTFLISLLIMPVLMGSSIVVQLLLKDVQDTRPQGYAIIDRTPGAGLVPAIREAIAKYNEDAENKGLPPFEIKETYEDDTASAMDQLRITLSE